MVKSHKELLPPLPLCCIIREKAFSSFRASPPDHSSSLWHSEAKAVTSPSTSQLLPWPSLQGYVILWQELPWPTTAGSLFLNTCASCREVTTVAFNVSSKRGTVTWIITDKDKKPTKLPPLTTRTASCWAGNATCPTEYTPNWPQEEGCNWGCTPPSQCTWPFPAADPILLGKPQSSLPGRTPAATGGTRLVVLFLNSSLASSHSSPQPFTAAVRFGREWRSRQIWRLRLQHCSYQPALRQFTHQLPTGISPLGWWHLRFLRAQEPMDTLSVQGHRISKGSGGREEKTTLPVTGIEEQTPWQSTYVFHGVKAHGRSWGWQTLGLGFWGKSSKRGRKIWTLILQSE